VVVFVAVGVVAADGVGVGEVRGGVEVRVRSTVCVRRGGDLGDHAIYTRTALVPLICDQAGSVKVKPGGRKSTVLMLSAITSPWLVTVIMKVTESSGA